MKYLKVDMGEIEGGLSHQIFNLFTLLKYCYINDYILIVPMLKLDGRHNNGKEIYSNLSEYIDYSSLKLVDSKANNFLKVCLNESEIEKEQIICLDNIKCENKILETNNLFAESKKVEGYFNFKYNKKIINYANSISEFLKEYTCVHVRRTDRLYNNEQLALDTSVDKVLQKIDKCECKNVYIMTDEKVEFFHKLKSNVYYNIHFYNDFEELRKIKIKDNYMLFCIENVIMNNAKKRVSTFKINNTFFNYYLSEQLGWL